MNSPEFTFGIALLELERYCEHVNLIPLRLLTTDVFEYGD
jgi:hypothetical protein